MSLITINNSLNLVLKDFKIASWFEIKVVVQC